MQPPPQASPSGQIATMSVDQLRGLQVRCRAVILSSPLVAQKEATSIATEVGHRLL